MDSKDQMQIIYYISTGVEHHTEEHRHKHIKDTSDIKRSCAGEGFNYHQVVFNLHYH